MDNFLPFDDSRVTGANDLRQFDFRTDVEDLMDAAITSIMNKGIAELHYGGADGHQPHPDGTPQSVHAGTDGKKADLDKELGINELFMLKYVMSMPDKTSTNFKDIYANPKIQHVMNEDEAQEAIDYLVDRGLAYKKMKDGAPYYRKGWEFDTVLDKVPESEMVKNFLTYGKYKKTENLTKLDLEGSASTPKHEPPKKKKTIKPPSTVYPPTGAFAEEKKKIPIPDNRKYVEFQVNGMKTKILAREGFEDFKGTVMEDSEYVPWAEESKTGVKKNHKGVADTLQKYQGSGSSTINSRLRYGTPAEYDFASDERIENMQDAFKYTNHPAPKDAVIFRGGRVSGIENIYEEFRAGRNKRFSDPAFMSSSTQANIALSWNQHASDSVLFVLRIPEGMKALPIRYGMHDHEREVAMPAAQDWKIVGMHNDYYDGNDEISQNNYIVVLEPIQP